MSTSGDFDLCNLTKTVEDIEIETKELDEELATVQKEVELKETELTELISSNEITAQKQAKIDADLISLRGASKQQEAFDIKEKSKHLKELTEEIAEAEVELRKLEGFAEMWQNRKFDMAEYQRQNWMQIEEQIQNGPLGLRLLEIEKQIKELDAEEDEQALQNLKENVNDLMNEATTLSEQGKIMEQDSIVMSKELSRLEKELSDLKSATRLTESRVAAKKIRYSKLIQNQ